jgi:hypothetical protein
MQEPLENYTKTVQKNVDSATKSKKAAVSDWAKNILLRGV